MSLPPLPGLLILFKYKHFLVAIDDSGYALAIKDLKNLNRDILVGNPVVNHPSFFISFYRRNRRKCCS